MDDIVKNIEVPAGYTPEPIVETISGPDALRIISHNYSTEYIQRLSRASDTDVSSTAYRVGSRIRLIRKAKGLSQTELGEMVGLTADRVQKYENGIRKPKSELIQEFATALGVDRKALEDPVISDPLGTLFALFEMEMLYGIKLTRMAGTNDMTLSFRNAPSEVKALLADWERAYKYFNEMINSKTSNKELKEVVNSYILWKYSFQRDPISDVMQKRSQREKIKRQIEILSRELEKLGEE